MWPGLIHAHSSALSIMESACAVRTRNDLMPVNHARRQACSWQQRNAAEMPAKAGHV
jgi:hypothetical protein